jgi:hypothetical protein
MVWVIIPVLRPGACGMTLKRWLKLSLVIAIMCVPTWFLFCLPGAFHHMYSFGLLYYMIWNGEDPSVVDFYVGDTGVEVIVNPVRIALTCFIWLVILAFVVTGVRSPRPHYQPNE